MFRKVCPQCAGLLNLGSCSILLLLRWLFLHLEIVKDCPDVFVRVVGDLPADRDGGVVGAGGGRGVGLDSHRCWRSAANLNIDSLSDMQLSGLTCTNYWTEQKCGTIKQVALYYTNTC